jgi:ABC-type lipoprotein release transport system permease subunit
MKKSFKTVLNIFTDAEKRKRFFKAIIYAIVNLPRNLIVFTTFFILLLIFMLRLTAQFLYKVPILSNIIRRIVPQSLISNLNNLGDKIVNRIEKVRSFKVKRYYLINLAFNNLKIKKSRSLITIFGMSVGVGIIVYLLSLGYGIERLVISKVARLEELKMADVLPSETGNVKINQKLIAKIRQIKNVEKVLPVVSVVGKVDYKNAKTDILSYAVTEEYMQVLASQFLKGSYFSDKGQKLTMETGQVKGISTAQLPRHRYGTEISQAKVLFNLKPELTVPLRNECDVSAKILGYVKRVEGGYIGTEYWGSGYAPYNPFGRAAFDPGNNLYLGKWLKAKMPVYDKLPEDKLQPQLDDQGRWLWEEGCVMQSMAVVQDRLQFVESVLGEATESAAVTASDSASLSLETNEASISASPEFEVTVVASGSGGLELVSLASTASASLTKKKTEEFLKFRSLPSGKAVISTGMANYLNIPLNKVIKERFKVSFIMVRSLLKEASNKLITQEVEYEIIGLIDDDTAEYFYIPIFDLERLGLQNYSQLKVIAKDKNSLKAVRHDIEVLGVTTSSTADTVAQIEDLFVNIRLLLGLLGTIALGVAALGMFNTLTVSLLERTREIGGMKTMGMVSEEIQELFLSEAMIMGFAGGIGGLILGYLMGGLTSFILSLFSVTSGVGYLNINYVPAFLVLFILTSSFLVGLVTGLYPARRAKHTSALNALRYE